MPDRQDEMGAATYAWRQGARVRGVAAQVVGEELAALHAEQGHVTAGSVVDRARPVNAPLHPAFEWRDKVAGENWRQHQARNLIRSVVVVQPHGEDPLPQSVHVTEGKSGRYLPTSVVARDESLYALALGELERAARSARRAVEDLQRAAEQEGLSKGAAINIALGALSAFESAIGALRH